MKKIIILLVLLAGFIPAMSQGGNDPNKYTWYKYLYGNRTARIWGDTVNNIPSDTTWSKDGLARKGSTLYVGNGTYWTAVGTGIPTLQQVTDVGHITTEQLVSRNHFGYQLTTAANQAIAQLKANSTDDEGVMELDDILGNKTIYTLDSILYKDSALIFPHKSGTIALLSDITGGSNIYNSDGIITDALRTVDVDNNTLLFDDAGGFEIITRTTGGHFGGASISPTTSSLYVDTSFVRAEGNFVKMGFTNGNNIYIDGLGRLRANQYGDGAFDAAFTRLIGVNSVGDFVEVDTTGLFASGGSGTPALQQVFDTEVGGSVLTKSDTVDMSTNNLTFLDGKFGIGAVSNSLFRVGETSKSFIVIDPANDLYEFGDINGNGNFSYLDIQDALQVTELRSVNRIDLTTNLLKWNSDTVATRAYARSVGGSGSSTNNYYFRNTGSTGVSESIAINDSTVGIKKLTEGTSGSDFNIASGDSLLTFNLPTASASNRGALSSTDWSTFSGKQTALSGTGLVSFSGTTPSYNTTSASIFGIISDETGGGVLVGSSSPTIATPTFTTNATTPLVIGGTGTTSTLTLQSTSGSGTTGSDIIFKDDNTELMRLLNSGSLGIGTTSPDYPLQVEKTVTGDVLINATNLSTAGGAVFAGFRADNSSSYGQMFKTGTNYSAYKTLSASDLGFYNSGAGNISILNDYSGGNITLTAGAASSPNILIDPAGFIGINKTSPAYRLDIGSQVHIDSITTSTNGTDSIVVTSNGVLKKIAFGQADYTPSASNTTNIASITPSVCHYSRTGNTVTYWGEIVIQTNAGSGQTSFNLSIPVPSGFTATHSAGGSFTAPLGGGITRTGSINADATNDILYISYAAAAADNSVPRTFAFNVSYKIE